jgi:hypothetical protein
MIDNSARCKIRTAINLLCTKNNALEITHELRAVVYGQNVLSELRQ